jgi:hypothetical protein
MRHLADVEIVDLIENALAPDRARHVEDCRECRERADALRAALARAADVEVPEPSPLFWEHFSGRIRERVQEEQIDRFGDWFPWLEGPAVKWAFSGALIALVIVAGIFTIRSSRHSDEPTMVSGASRGSEAAPDDAALSPADIDTDEAWALVRAAADDASWEDAVGAGVASGPGQAERAALTLTPDERLELLQLLRAETKRPGA